MMYDCLVIGGGPAGLTAAIYLARFHLRVLVIDRGQGRAMSIPMTHNQAGYPDGIAGRDLVMMMRRQATRYGAEFRIGNVTSLTAGPSGFSALTGGRLIHAQSVLLATGVVNHRPAMAESLHEEALSRGLLRYCPVCDGYEVTDTVVGVIGTGENGFTEATFLRSYTQHVTLISPEENHLLSDEQLSRLVAYKVRHVIGPISTLEIEADRIVAEVSGRKLPFSSIYAAMGSMAQSQLAKTLDASLTDAGCIQVDSHQRTTVAGLYAAGDVVPGLDQIASAMGQAAIAATTIRNDMSASRTLLR